ncbi:MAG TPA: YicC/YloC family endoribonuclease [Usitatibacter sp.]|nr:YicC/YloC family endoribonuclease [Usitatibacter sp.]
MISSMTGFAAASLESAQGSLGVELKTVNHRYLEFQTRMPEELRPFEPAMREAVAAKLTRGKVDCRITFTPLTATASALLPDAAAMAALHAAAHLVIGRFPDARPLSVSEVLHWPGVLSQESLSADEVKEQVLGLIDRAIKELNQSRAREGAKLEAILRERLDGMAALVKEAQPLIPGAVKAFQEKLAAKIAEAAASPSDERVHQEIVLYASRIDVDEEIGRLNTHISEYRRVLDKGGACGKRLDFLCQELNREANTLGSKSVANEMTRISVELKVLIEQMREQVQNIE